MSNTPEQAAELWCPMARVAQTGNTDTQAAYNRTLNREVRPVNVAVIQNPESFELGTAPMPEQGQILALDTSIGQSKAARCVADKCAMWRWDAGATITGYCGLAGRPEVMA